MVACPVGHVLRLAAVPEVGTGVVQPVAITVIGAAVAGDQRVHVDLPATALPGRHARGADIHELDDLRMCDIPPQSHLEILGLPHPTGAVIEVYGLNTGEVERQEEITTKNAFRFGSPLENLSPHRARPCLHAVEHLER